MSEKVWCCKGATFRPLAVMCSPKELSEKGKLYCSVCGDVWRGGKKTGQKVLL